MRARKNSPYKTRQGRFKELRTPQHRAKLSVTLFRGAWRLLPLGVPEPDDELEQDEEDELDEDDE